MALRGKIMKNEFKKLSNRQKIAYYKSVGNDSLADNRRAIDKNNEGQGLTWRQVKINSKNLQKLMKKRGLSQFDTMQLKKSFAKWDGQNNHKGGNLSVRQTESKSDFSRILYKYVHCRCYKPYTESVRVHRWQMCRKR